MSNWRTLKNRQTIMQKNNKRRLHFGKKETDIGSKAPLPPSAVATLAPASAWYRSITTLPLTKFIDVAVDKNYAALVISGFPDPQELVKTWGEIQQQYADAIGDTEHSVYKMLFGEINLLLIKYQEIQLLVKTLRWFYYAPLAEQINDLLNTAFEFNPYDNEAYQKQLDICLNMSKAFKIDCDLKSIHFKSIQDKNTGGGYTREYFQSILITLSDYAKYQIEENITVFQFCERIKRLRK
jgi:hypothetical protein